MTLNFSQFIDNWPESRKNQFSYDALRVIFDYLERYEDETGEKVEFDPIAICCEYTEYEGLKSLQSDYPDIETMEELAEHTTVLPIEGKESFVIRQF